METGDQQGWHFDSNEITGVLYLTSTEKTGFTEIDPLNSNSFVKVFPKAGSLLLLQGRECWHRASPVADGEEKVICTFNFFRAQTEQNRDANMNPIIFGESIVNQATKKLILVKAGPTNTDQWVDNLQLLLTEFEVQRWDSVFEPSDVEYVVGWMPNALWANQFPNLKALVSIGSGVDHIKHLDQFRTDVPIIRTVSDDLVERMKEFVVTSVLLWHRRVLEMVSNQRRKVWHKYTAPLASEIRVGIMGFGSMGRQAATALADLGYRVSVWANSPRAEVEFDYYFGKDQLNDFVSGLDALVCMLPNTPETSRILSKSLFDRLNDGACVINVGRGAHLEEQDLLDAISQGKIKNTVLDVFDEEPLPGDSPLWENQQILISSHSAAYIAPDLGPKIISENILRFEHGGYTGPIYDPKKRY